MSVAKSVFKGVMLLAAVGLFCSALVMAGDGYYRIFQALGAILGKGDPKGVAVSILSGTDVFLFSAVLGIMSGALFFNFVLDPEDLEKLGSVPKWIVIHDIAELKHILVDVILVYLIVDFATDMAEMDRKLDWAILVGPTSILIVALASRLMKS